MSHDDTVYEILIRIEAKVDKINGRVGSLENWRAYIMGALAVIGAGVTWLLTKIK